MKHGTRCLIGFLSFPCLLCTMATMLLLLSANPISAQFTEIDPGLPKSANPCVVWGDYDNDGDLDVLVAGAGKQDVAFTTIYNNSDRVFTNSGIILLGTATAGATGTPLTRLYRQRWRRVHAGGTSVPQLLPRFGRLG